MKWPSSWYARQRSPAPRGAARVSDDSDARERAQTHGADKHRFRCAAHMAALLAAIESATGVVVSDADSLSYVDDESDQIRIRSDAELAEALRVATVNGVLRLTLERSLPTKTPPTTTPR